MPCLAYAIKGGRQLAVANRYEFDQTRLPLGAPATKDSTQWAGVRVPGFQSVGLAAPSSIYQALLPAGQPHHVRRRRLFADDFLKPAAPGFEGAPFFIVV